MSLFPFSKFLLELLPFPAVAHPARRLAFGREELSVVPSRHSGAELSADVVVADDTLLGDGEPAHQYLGEPFGVGECCLREAPPLMVGNC